MTKKDKFLTKKFEAIAKLHEDKELEIQAASTMATTLGFVMGIASFALITIMDHKIPFCVENPLATLVAGSVLAFVMLCIAPAWFEMKLEKISERYDSKEKVILEDIRSYVNLLEEDNAFMSHWKSLEVNRDEDEIHQTSDIEVPDFF